MAAAEFEQVVHLYDLQKLELLSTHRTTLDFGGRRLAISEDGSVLIAGAYHVYGIAAYSGNDGHELWRRKDLKKVQQVQFDSNCSRLLCCFENHPFECLSSTSGRSGKSIRGIRNAWASPVSPVRVYQRKNDYVIADFEAPIATIAKAGFAILSAAFSRSFVCISEAGGLVRMFNACTGAEAWRSEPPDGNHFLELAFCEAIGSFVGVSWPYQEGGRVLLQQFAADGRPSVIAEVGPATEVVFCVRGSKLITALGAVYEVGTGELSGTLPFPTVASRRI